MTASPAGPPAGSSPGPRGGSPAPIPPAPKPSPPGIRALFALRDARRRWPFALRAAVCMGTPVLAGWAAGNTTAGLMGTIGAFTSLYGSGRPYLNRALHLAIIAVALALGVALGIQAAVVAWAGVVTVAIIAMAATLLCNALAVGPPGAYMFTLACAAGTGMHAEHFSPWHTGLLVLAGGAFAWLVHLSGALLWPRGPEKAAVRAAADAVAAFAAAAGTPRQDTARHWAKLLNDLGEAPATLYGLEAYTYDDMVKKYGKPPAKLENVPLRGAIIAVANVDGRPQVAALGTISLAVVPNGLPASEVGAARAAIVKAADAYIAVDHAQGYRVGFEPDPSGHGRGIQFWGASFAAGPQGELLAMAEERPTVLMADVDLARGEAVRRIWPYLRDRRIDAYQPLLLRYRDRED